MVSMEDVDLRVIAQEAPAEDLFIAPSIHDQDILLGRSYTYHSSVPKIVADDLATECVLGVDEAGRGPVLGGWLVVFAFCLRILPDIFQGLWSMDSSISH